MPDSNFTMRDIALVIVWGNKVTGDILQPLRFHTSNEVARSYLQTQSKDKLTNEQFDEVDWEHLDQAMKNKPDMYRV